MTQLISWNVNGLRAVMKKGFLEWIEGTHADVICLQETKLQEAQIPEELLNLKGYQSCWHSAKKKGYSSVASFYKKEALAIHVLGIDEFDDEGRFEALEYHDYLVINCYFPNSQAERNRLDYKLRFCNAVLKFCQKWRKKGKGIVLCGDYNIAHTAIDLARPDSNKESPGYYIEERKWMTKYLKKGYVDVFRHLHPDETDHYSWWSYRTQARERNVGWRIDYHSVNEEFLDCVKSAKILSDIMGSDHCPVMLTLK